MYAYPIIKTKIGVALATTHHNDAPTLVTSHTRTLVGILYDLEVDANKYHQKIIKPVKIQSCQLYHVDCDTNILDER